MSTTSNLYSVIVGGITGYNNNNGQIINCYSTGNVTANSDTRNNYVGGIAGQINGAQATPSKIQYCWASGSIYSNFNNVSSGGFYARLGGIAGYAYSSNAYAQILNCAALNSTINHTGGTSGVNLFYDRILGNVNGGTAASGQFSNNYYNSGMSMTYSATLAAANPAPRTGYGHSGANSFTYSTQSNWGPSTGPQWTVNSAKAAASESSPWVWGTSSNGAPITSRPILWFEVTQ
jgi:hypothetical protein